MGSSSQIKPTVSSHAFAPAQQGYSVPPAAAAITLLALALIGSGTSIYLSYYPIHFKVSIALVAQATVFAATSAGLTVLHYTTPPPVEKPKEDFEVTDTPESSDTDEEEVAPVAQPPVAPTPVREELDLGILNFFQASLTSGCSASKELLNFLATDKLKKCLVRACEDSLALLIMAAISRHSREQSKDSLEIMKQLRAYSRNFGAKYSAYEKSYLQFLKS